MYRPSEWPDVGERAQQRLRRENKRVNNYATLWNVGLLTVYDVADVAL